MGAARLGLCLALARPGELVALALPFGYITQKIAQRVKVDDALKLSFGVFRLRHNLRE